MKVTKLNVFWRVAAAVALIGLALCLDRPASAAKQAAYNQFDVLLDVQPNGDLLVTETQVVAFSGGSFANGHRNIPLTRTEGIDHVTVAEQTDAGVVPFRQVGLTDLPNAVNQYSATVMGDSLFIDWHFTPETNGQRTFVVSYLVHGVLRVYPDASPPNQQIWWTAVSSKLTDQTPVRAATATFQFPKALDLDKTHTGEDGTGKAIDHTRDGQTFSFSHGAFSAGDEMIVRMIFPPVISGAQPPSWQAADDAARAEAQTRQEHSALLALISGAAALVVLIAGGLLLYGLWYMRGRDPHAGLVASFLPQPPDSLSPGVVGTLLDEKADERDVVATFLDLARRGIITITDAGLNRKERRAVGRDYDLTIAKENPSLAPYEATIFQAVFGADRAVGAKARLGQSGQSLRAAYPKVKQQLYEALVDRGLFVKSPEATRKRWRSISRWLVSGFTLAGLIVGFAVSWFVTIPFLAATLIAFLLGRLGGKMPQKTAAGAEAAAKWRAFSRYLKEIEKYEHLAEKNAIFERYLAFAVAFDLDTQWVAKFRIAGAPLPGWFSGGFETGPIGRAFTGWDFNPVYSNPDGGSGVDLPDLKMPNLPNMQTMSNKAGGSVQSSSSGLMSLLNLAGVILEVVSAVSGGTSGGSSGGGGGSFD